MPAISNQDMSSGHNASGHNTTGNSGNYRGFAQSIEEDINSVALGGPNNSSTSEDQDSRETPLPRYEDDELPSPPPVPEKSSSHNSSQIRRDESSLDDETHPLVQWGFDNTESNAVVVANPEQRNPLNVVNPHPVNLESRFDPLPRPPFLQHQQDDEPKYARVDLRNKRSSKHADSREGTPVRHRRRETDEDGIRTDNEESLLLPRTGNGNISNRNQLLRRPSSSVASLTGSTGNDVIVDRNVENVDNVLPKTTTFLGGSTDSLSICRPRMEVVREISKRSNRLEESDVVDAKKAGCDALQATVTALYCKILVILGLAFPMAEVISDNVPKGYYQLFYVYLFFGCLLFLFFIYIDLLRTKARLAVDKKIGKKAREKAAGTGNSGKDDSSRDNDSVDCSTASIPTPRVYYGSFYLRLGAVLFGVGSMIYSGIEIGMFFELSMDDTSTCRNLFSIVRPVLQMTFVFVQMYFIFLNQKMNIYKHKFLSRIGMMHMIAANLCVWLNVLILETSHEIVGKHHDGDEDTSGHHLPTNESLAHDHYGDLMTTEISTNLFDLSHLTSLCHRKHNIMSQLLEDAAPFLFPCTIEYSLICAAIEFVMWKNIAEEHEHYKFQRKRIKICKTMGLEKNRNRTTQFDGEAASTVTGNGGLGHERSPHHYTVDCTRANTGLFIGIFVMVLTIISVIVFFVLIHSEDGKLQHAAIMVASLTELSLYTLTTMAVLVGMYQTRVLWYDTSRKLELDNLLLVVSQTGVFIYSAFCIIGAFFQLKEHLLAFLASLATLVQTTLQTLFILDASSRFAYNADQVKKKPGREVVTFLLVCNLAMWAINSLETNRADSHPIQVRFYGGEWAWPIITHVSMPLAIFYRFHSTVCLCEIWKKSFKYKSSNLAYV